MRSFSWFISFIKIVLGATFVAFLGMLYWSSLSIEERLKTLSQEINEIKVNAPLEAMTEAKSGAAVNRVFVDPLRPNLLEEDPFYASTLPAMLGPSFRPYGTRRGAIANKPENLHPFSNWRDVSEWQRLCNTSIAKSWFGFYEKYAPAAAFKVEERMSLDNDVVEYWVHLKEGLFWQPLKPSFFPSNLELAPHFLKKHPLTAHDFKFQFDVVMNSFFTETGAVVMRQYYNDIAEFKVLDDLTFVVKWKTFPVDAEGKTVKKPRYLSKSLTLSMSPLAAYVYQYYPDGSKIIDDDSYRTNSTFAQNFTLHWAKNIIPSCGPWVFTGIGDEGIAFKRNKEQLDPLDCLVQGLEVQFKQTDEAIWQAFKLGEIDTYALQADHLLEYKAFLESPLYKSQESRGRAVKRLDYMARSFSYIGWNQARPLFSSEKVRKALTLAIDRKRIIAEFFQGMGVEIACPFSPYSSAYDTSLKPYPYDPLAAKKLLEEEGFSIQKDGYLAKKEGDKLLKFEFSLTYFSKSSRLKAICEFIATSLKEIGIMCRLNGVDIADLSGIFDDKNFDAYVMAWALGSPPEDPWQLWHSSGAIQKGSSNAIGFQNKEADKIIEALVYEYDEKKRAELFKKFNAILYRECPYTLLFVPKVAYLYREYIQNVFVPAERKDIVPGAVVAEPDPSIYWIKPPP